MYETTRSEFRVYFAELEKLHPEGVLMSIVTRWLGIQEDDALGLSPTDIDWLSSHCPERGFSIARRHALEREQNQKACHVGDRWIFRSNETSPGEEDLEEIEQICSWYFLEYLGHFYVPRSPRVKVDKRPRIRRCQVCSKLFIAEKVTNTICSKACRSAVANEKRKVTK